MKPTTLKLTTFSAAEMVDQSVGKKEIKKLRKDFVKRMAIDIAKELIVNGCIIQSGFIRRPDKYAFEYSIMCHVYQKEMNPP